MLELALLPGVARFFIGLLAVLIVVGSVVLTTYWLSKGGED